MSDTVVITGAASGMGLATARRFAAEGWLVVAVDRDAEALERAARSSIRRVHAADRRCHRSSCAGCPLGRVLEGRTLKAVINAAGIYPPTTLADFTENSYRRIFDVNVLGTLNLCAVTRRGSRRRAEAGS